MKPLMVYFLVFSFVWMSTPIPSQATTADEAYLKGSALYGQGKWKESIVQFEEAIRLNPDHWQAYQGLGYAYVKDGNMHAGLNACTISLRINPNNPSLREFVRVQFNSAATPTKLTRESSGDSAPVAVALTVVAGVVILLLNDIHVSGGC